MKTLRNLKEHVSGLVECEILLGEEWHPHAIESAEEYELHESSDWTDVKPCDQSEKDAHAAQEAHTQITQSMVSITNGIPQIEIDSWPRQEKEAREYLADNTASVPFITKLALARGIELSVLVDKIIKKADAYETALAKTMGAKHKLEDEMGK